MSDALWVSKPGGYRVATDEVFALHHATSRLVSGLATQYPSLTRLAREYADEDIESAIRQTREVLDYASHLMTALNRYAQQVAEQEAARRELFDRPTDAALFALVAWAMGDSQAAGLHGGWRQALTDQPRLGWGSKQGVVPESVADDAAATVLLGAGPYRSELAVREAGPSRGVTIASGVAERIARIPDWGTPVTIERFTLADGSTHTEVFISGTAEWSLEESSSPFDMRSNLALVAGLPAASVSATEAAMRQAGVSQGDRVLFVGHSQGGAVAATLARSGRYETAGLITVGAPTATIAQGQGYPALIIEHRDDLVPRVAGVRVDQDALVVTTHSGARFGDVAEAHSKERYEATAGRVDRSPDSDLSGFTEDFPRGVTGIHSRFRAEQSG